MAQDSRSMSNYAGTNAIRLNPAELADNRAKIFVNLGQLHLNYQNSYSRWVADHGFLKSVLQPGAFPGNYDISDTQSNKFANLNTTINGPSILWSFPKQQLGVAIGVQTDVFASFQNSTDVTATFLYKGLYFGPLQNQVHPNEEAEFNLGMYNQFFISAGKVLYNDHERTLKIGGTVKRLTSGLSLNMIGDRMDYQVNPLVSGQRENDVFFDRVVGNFQNASNEFTPSFGWASQQILNPNNIGSGFGIDLGFVYEFRPNYRKQWKKYKREMIPNPSITKYKWKLGVSFQDIGYLRFNDPSVRVGQVDRSNELLQSGVFNGVASPDEFLDVLENEFSLNPNSYTQSFNVLTPAMIVVHGDYAIKNNWYIGFALRQRLLTMNRKGPSKRSSLTFAPRYESKWFEFMMPVSIDQDYKTLNVGLTGRLGPLFLGVTDYTMLIRGLKSRGIGIEAGLSFPINYTKPKSPLKCYFEEKVKKKRKRK